MAKVRINSEIENYYLKENTIEILFGNPNDTEGSVYTISRIAFEMWLESQGKSKCSIIKGEEEIEGDMTIAEYWEDTERVVRYSDLKDFMLIIECRELASSNKMLRSALVEMIAAVTNNEFAAQCLEQVSMIEENTARFQMCQPIEGKTVHAVPFGQFTS